MRTSFLNFQTISKINNYKYKNINNKKEATPAPVAFTGAQKNDDKPQFCQINLIPIFKNPALYVQNRLVKDGFDSRDIADWDIYSVQEDEETAEAGVRAFKSDYASLVKKERSREMLFKSKKSSDDVMAMSRVYNALRDDFRNEDTEAYANAFAELNKVFEKNFGVTASPDQPVKDLILQTLSYTNKYNEHVTKALLKDENFNNINIPQAIAGIDSKQRAESALIVLSNAQQAGYKKDFSLPLAVMLSNAKPKNIPIITKALDEQEFLKENTDFVSKKLPKFLDDFDYIAISYLKDPFMSLREVSELMDLETEEEDIY